jgi:hypothetical protein
MIRRFKDFGGLVESPAGFWLFMRVGVWIAVVTLLLRLVSMPRLMKILMPRKISQKKWPRSKIVNFASFWLGRERAFFQRSCLKRSLVLFRYLNMQSEPARFIIGVRKNQGELAGHSWIMIEGKPLFDDEDMNYKVIFSFPEDRGAESKTDQ